MEVEGSGRGVVSRPTPERGSPGRYWGVSRLSRPTSGDPGPHLWSIQAQAQVGCIPACTEAGTHTPPGDGYCYGRYASYLNAFLSLRSSMQTERQIVLLLIPIIEFACKQALNHNESQHLREGKDLLYAVSISVCSVTSLTVWAKGHHTIHTYYYRPQRSCGQGYVFTHVCDSVHRGGLEAGRNPPRGRREHPPAGGRTPPAGGRPPQTRQTTPW